MTISYNWVSEYLSERIDPQQLSSILTSIGLEVESMEPFERIKGSLAGVVVGEVLECVQHPNADKLKLTKVNIGKDTLLKIVCGAANVAVGQKVLVATVGATIYPTAGGSITLKAAKIRGEESEGMICAEDELGLGSSHAGIMVLPADSVPGTSAFQLIKPYSDTIYEIGLTPNRMDAMSHLGVAKDVSAYLTHHNRQPATVKAPFPKSFSPDDNDRPIKVVVENTKACRRYSGISITGVTVSESPQWLKDKLVAINQRPINNIVDITNFILHETGQPLHAFDLDSIAGDTVIVKNLPDGTVFTTLDEKERKLTADDLMICNANEGMCIAGVFGGAKSGVKPETTSIFLESAFFDSTTIRKTSFRHDLRTEAAARFEKGVDISNTVQVLQRAALLIKELAGGRLSSGVVDVYPEPQPRTVVTLQHSYLTKLSGKQYEPNDVKEILTALGFTAQSEDAAGISVAVPYSKPDISLPADIVEEVLRIDGLDNVQIGQAMQVTPATDTSIPKENLRDKIAGFLTGAGFNEIVTNSITDSKLFSAAQLETAVKMINSLSADLDVMRPTMIETGLDSIAYNLNRKNKDLQFFEFGKTYHAAAVGNYSEREHLALYLTGNTATDSWRAKATQADFYKAKGLASAIAQLCGVAKVAVQEASVVGLSIAVEGKTGQKTLFTIGEVSSQKLKQFDIKQPVFFLDFDWLLLVQLATAHTIVYKEVSKFPAMQRDLALVVNKNVTFQSIQNAVDKTKLSKLQELQLFDIFESDKLGAGKKSMAVSLTFMDEAKTLTDKEIDGMMSRLVKTFETELGAEIRK